MPRHRRRSARLPPLPPLPPACSPLVIAHRGASTSAPEHTIAAYQAAIEQGADGVECDVRLTADGFPVCVHDRRVERTSDGIGVVSALELADLETLDFAAVDRLAADAAPGVDCHFAGVLTLDRLLALVCDAGRPLEVAIETKHPTRYAGLVERRVLDTLRRFGLLPTAAVRRSPTAPLVRVMSFSTLGLRRVRERAPLVPTVLLIDRLPLVAGGRPSSAEGTTGRPGGTAGLAGPRGLRLPRGVGTVGPSIDLIRRRPDLVAEAHARGYRVHVWTVNEPVDVALCADLGVDAVITDRPLAAREVLSRGLGPAPMVPEFPNEPDGAV